MPSRPAWLEPSEPSERRYDASKEGRERGVPGHMDLVSSWTDSEFSVSLHLCLGSFRLQSPSQAGTQDLLYLLPHSALTDSQDSRAFMNESIEQGMIK